MVFKLISSGKHTKKINGKNDIDNHYHLEVNPFGEDNVYLSTKEDSNQYKGKYDNFDAFLKTFNNNNRSLFDMARRGENAFTKKRRGFRRKFREIKVLKPGKKGVRGKKGKTGKFRRFKNLFAHTKKKH